MGPVAGWYGKIPSLGDFASRRLPTEFIKPWDAWLQGSMAASRQILADRWLDLYLDQPNVALCTYAGRLRRIRLGRIAHAQCR